MSPCFDCQNRLEDDVCKLGIDNSSFRTLDDLINQCDKFSPCLGFQMGGYYTFTHFERLEGDNSCVELVIHGDLEFPIADGDPDRVPTEIHLCDFRQVENWVKFWGAELRRRGWVRDE